MAFTEPANSPVTFMDDQMWAESILGTFMVLVNDHSIISLLRESIKHLYTLPQALGGRGLPKLPILTQSKY